MFSFDKRNQFFTRQTIVLRQSIVLNVLLTIDTVAENNPYFLVLFLRLHNHKQALRFH